MELNKQVCLMLEVVFNSIKFQGHFDRNALKQMLAVIHRLSNQGYNDIMLDFKQLTGGFARDLVPLAAVCRTKLHNGVDVLLELPVDSKLARLFNNSNWSYLIDPRTHQESQFCPENHLPALTYSDSDGHSRQVDQIMELLLRQLKLGRDQLAALEWAVNEITDNVLNHAQSPIGGIVQTSVDKKRNLLEFVVCDTGVSIPKTLQEGHAHITSDTEALDRAIREGVTRNTVTNMGNGLFGAYRIAQLSKGFFSIYSRHATLEYSEKNGLQVRRDIIPYPGTVVNSAIRLNNPELLREALQFKGEVYVPSYSYVDRIVDQNEILLNLKTESSSFGSRVAGQGIKNKIANLMASGCQRIVLDLSDVPLISSSYADEVFGKVFSELGPLTYMSKIQITGTNRVVSQLIERAIAQRMALLASPRIS